MRQPEGRAVSERQQLVVTADDVGLASGMTRGALDAAARGIVTAMSVTTVGEGFAEAVRELRGQPAIDIGAHLVLVGEAPLSPPAEVSSLLGGNGRLLPEFGAFCRRYACGGVVLAQVRLELTRQLERLLASGLVVRHLNSHQHLHALPRIFDQVAALAAAHGVTFVRLPEDPLLPPPLSPRAVALRCLRALARRCRRRLREPVAALDGTLGLAVAGHLTPDRLGALLRGEWRGRFELVCHPGAGDAALAARYPWGYDWDAERAALCDPALPALLAEQGIELTSFSRLTAPSTPAAASRGTP